MSQTTANDVLEQLKSTRPILLWICVPGNETGLDAKAQNRLKQLAMWTNDQLERQGAIFIEVPNISIAKTLRDYATDLPRVTNLKWCNLGVTHPQSKRPIGSRATIMHNLDITELHNCQCKSAADGQHMRVSDSYNQQHDAHDQRLIRQTFQSMCAAVVLTACASQPHFRQHFPDTMELNRNITQFLGTLKTRPLDRLSNEQQQQLGIHINVATTLDRNTPLAFTAITDYDMTAMYPTESRMRQKAKEQELKDSGQEIVKKKRVKIVEKGADDMGECVETLPMEDAADAYYDLGLCGDRQHEHLDCLDPDTETFLVDLEANVTPYNWLFGAEAGQVRNMQYDSMEQFLVYWRRDHNDDEFIDLVEICGGSSRTSQVLIKRHHMVRVGLNFDIVVGFDLLKANDVKHLWLYLRGSKPLVVALATPCTGLAGYAGINAIRGCPMHFHNLEISERLGTLGGEVA